MKLASIRLVAGDIRAMVGFYEVLTGQPAQCLASVFAEIVTSGATLTLPSSRHFKSKVFRGKS